MDTLSTVDVHYIMWNGQMAEGQKWGGEMLWINWMELTLCTLRPEQNGCRFVNFIFKCICMIDVQKVGQFDGHILNRSAAQIPQCVSPVSHNAPFCNRNVHMCAHFCYKMVHCGIFVWCIMGFVLWLHCYKMISALNLNQEWNLWVRWVQGAWHWVIGYTGLHLKFPYFL